jgi:outer membrane biosynthesis protein TonB
VLAPGVRLLEGKRISGNKVVVPDDTTKEAMRRGRITGRFRLCVGKNGKIKSVVPLQSTGFASYDRRILSAIKDWVYAPYTVDDHPVPVCTSVTFIYTQR